MTAPWSIRIAVTPGGTMVDAKGKVHRISLAEGAVAWLAGEVDAIRARSGEWVPVLGTGNLPIDPTDPAGSASRLEGRFVLVIQHGGRCWVGTDPQGRADVYVSADGSTLATDLSLLENPAGAGYDAVGWAHTLVAYGARPAKRHTLYAGVRRLGVGESVSIEDGQLSSEYRPFVPERTRPLETRSLDEYADRLLDAIQVRGSRNGNVVYLSSGWDSTAILACLVHLFGPRKVRAVIGRMRYAERSGVINQFEIDRARAVADYYGVPLDVAEFDYRTEGPAVLDAVRPMFRDHHLANATGLNHYILARHVAETTNGDETVFAGEISDGAHNLGFSQFVSIFHPTQEFREYADKMAGYLFGPTFLGQLHAGTMEEDAVYQIMRGRMGGAVLDPPAATAAGRTRQLMASLFLRGTRFPLTSLQNVRVLTAEGASRYSEVMEELYLAEAAERATPETLYAWYLHLYNSFHWQGSTVAPLAITGEAFGLRMALPFWDSRLQETLAAMPEQAGRGLDLNPTKYPLKWTLRNRVDYPFHLQVGPHSYLYDIDPSFSHSAELMYGSSFRGTFTEALKARPHRAVLDPGLFAMDHIDGVVDRYVAGDEVRGAELGDLLNLAFTASVGWYGV
ncbi:MAG: hypothetical protein O2888_01180 [Chloroflexi bacterium]|nr:hypothetical protein [Chloroflexota bacterium]